MAYWVLFVMLLTFIAVFLVEGGGVGEIKRSTNEPKIRRKNERMNERINERTTGDDQNSPIKSVDPKANMSSRVIEIGKGDKCWKTS